VLGISDEETRLCILFVLRTRAAVGVKELKKEILQFFGLYIGWVSFSNIPVVLMWHMLLDTKSAKADCKCYGLCPLFEMDWVPLGWQDSPWMSNIDSRLSGDFRLSPDEVISLPCEDWDRKLITSPPVAVTSSTLAILTGAPKHSDSQYRKKYKLTI